MRTARDIVGVLMLALFALRCLVPHGFMLAPTSADPAHSAKSLFGLHVVICTGHGPASTAPGELGGLPPAHKPADQKASNDVCPYAGTGASKVVEFASHRLETTVRYAEIVYAQTAQVFAATPKPRSITARGPPSLT